MLSYSTIRYARVSLRKGKRISSLLQEVIPFSASGYRQ